MKNFVGDVLVVAGVSLIVYGVSLWSIALAYVIGGLGVVGLGALVFRK